MKKGKFDFSGWATKNDLRCADGRTIRKDAFADDDGRTVPLVWMHQHKEPENVLGHALLENRPEGVYAYCSFNETPSGKQAKEIVRHGDVCSLSIWANNLTQNGGNVMHGSIKEVSVVLAGANPGAIIDFPILSHGEESETEAYIRVDEPVNLSSNDELQHADEEEPKKDDDRTVQDVLDSMTEEQRKVVEYLVGKALGEKDEESEEEVKHADDEKDDGRTIQDVIDSMSEEQKKVLEYLVGTALEEKGADEDTEDEEDKEEKEVKHSDEGEDFDMKRNVFDVYGEGSQMNSNVLTHDQMTTIINDAKRTGSLKEAVLSHADEYGITQIDWLFPEYKNVNNPPEFIKRNMDWVSKVMNGVHHTPFSRIKSQFADITAEDARALGYIKGDKKKNEVFTLLRRWTDPQTIYKHQQLDRDDILDITDFDVVSWIKGEMRMMLDEELARAFLIGDGRDTSSRQHISEDHVRSVFRDNDLFVIRKELTGEEKASDLIDLVVKAFDEYEGSGNPKMFTTRNWRSDLLLLKDKMGHRLYKTENELATAMLVDEIITVPVMSATTTYRTDAKTGKHYRPVAIILNLNDYNVGADKGGSINMFDDFDIDYNQFKYLIETRCSGALTKPYSAIVIEEEFTLPSNTPSEDEDNHD